MASITIIGLGLIGGSIGMALKRAGVGGIIGYARNPEKARRAVELGAIDRAEENLISAADKADIVILTTPVLAMRDILKQIGNHLKSGCVVTDTGSTKAKVMAWAEEYLPSLVSFIGGHPMAGKELSGIEAAEANLFHNRPYCLVPSPKASPEAVQSVVNLVNRLGARPLFITAREHDEFVAGISHLPLLLSAALVSATSKSPSWEPMSKLASTGYRDLTRLASQSPEMNRDICLTNQENILAWIDRFIEELSLFRQLIAEGKGEALERAFIQARQARQRWLEEYGKKG